jgi:hypothetical protein
MTNGAHSGSPGDQPLQGTMLQATLRERVSSSGELPRAKIRICQLSLRCLWVNCLSFVLAVAGFPVQKPRESLCLGYGQD